MTYTVKLNEHRWSKDVNYVRVWFYMEASYIFIWIFSSCVFTTLAYIFKLKSSVKSDEDLLTDDNIWNDNDSDDYLRYIKHDFFIMVYLLSSFFNAIVWGFSQSKAVTTIGVRDFETTGICITTLLIMRALQVSIQTWKIT